MFDPRQIPARTDPLDALVAAAGVAWILAFVAAVGAALSKLVY